MAYPFVPEEAIDGVVDTLKSRWIGQGPKVDAFEKEFATKFGVENPIAVNSGTSALELAYELIGIKEGDEVITTPLTCTATNLPLIRRGAKLVFADIDRKTLTIDPEDIRKKITSKTRAIVVVDLHGIQATREQFYAPDDQFNVAYCIPVVVDAAQALGNTGGDYTCYSFQAIKHLTTGDGGMLVCADPEKAKQAKLWRWFGIDRTLKLANDWQPYKNREILFDIEFPGFKYQMNDIAAAMGLAGLKTIDNVMNHREDIFNMYVGYGLPMVDGPYNKHGYACLLVENRDEFAKKMAEAGIETNVMQVRNDVYKVFAPFRTELPNMDWVDERYICIPLHNQMTITEAEIVARTAKQCLNA